MSKWTHTGGSCGNPFFFFLNYALLSKGLPRWCSSIHPPDLLLVAATLSPKLGGPGLTLGQETRSHMPQVRVHMLKLKRSCMPQLRQHSQQIKSKRTKNQEHYPNNRNDSNTHILPNMNYFFSFFTSDGFSLSYHLD